jgi:hypothetical protein
MSDVKKSEPSYQEKCYLALQMWIQNQKDSDTALGLINKQILHAHHSFDLAQNKEEKEKLISSLTKMKDSMTLINDYLKNRTPYYKETFLDKPLSEIDFEKQLTLMGSELKIIFNYINLISVEPNEKKPDTIFISNGIEKMIKINKSTDKINQKITSFEEIIKETQLIKDNLSQPHGLFSKINQIRDKFFSLKKQSDKNNIIK